MGSGITLNHLQVYTWIQLWRISIVLSLINVTCMASLRFRVSSWDFPPPRFHIALHSVCNTPLPYGVTWGYPSWCVSGSSQLRCAILLLKDAPKAYLLVWVGTDGPGDTCTLTRRGGLRDSATPWWSPWIGYPWAHGIYPNIEGKQFSFKFTFVRLQPLYYISWTYCWMSPHISWPNLDFLRVPFTVGVLATPK